MAQSEASESKVGGSEGRTGREERSRKASHRSLYHDHSTRSNHPKLLSTELTEEFRTSHLERGLALVSHRARDYSSYDKGGIDIINFSDSAQGFSSCCADRSILATYSR